MRESSLRLVCEVDDSGQASSEEQRADVSSGLFASLEVYDLGVSGLVGIPEVLCKHIAHSGNFGELVADLGNSEIEVLGADEEDVIVLALPDRLEEAGDQLDQTTCLLEPLVLLKEYDDVLEARVEGGGKKRRRSSSAFYYNMPGASVLPLVV